MPSYRLAAECFMPDFATAGLATGLLADSALELRTEAGHGVF
jgi:hypothetical protein